MNASMLIQVTVTVMFLVSGVAKLADMESFHMTVFEVGSPAHMSRKLAWAVPVLELFSAATMLFESTRVVGHVVALGLLCSFALVTWSVIRKKAAIKCNCLGILAPERFGPITFARQAVLASGILFALADGAPFSWNSVSVVDWISSITLAVGIVLLYILLSNYLHYEPKREMRD